MSHSPADVNRSNWPAFDGHLNVAALHPSNRVSIELRIGRIASEETAAVRQCRLPDGRW